MEERQCVNFSSRDFDSRILSTLGQLQREKYFCDVTITCEDRQIEAHKVVLARGSPLFNKIIKLNPHPHPFIFLSGVKFSYLLNILNFMYQGEVSIDKRELDDFLAVARNLEVNNIPEETFKDSKQSDVDKIEMQLLASNPGQQINVKADYKVKTDDNPDDDYRSIGNYFKIDKLEDFETFTNEDFEDFDDESKDIINKKHPMDCSSEQDLNVDYIFKIGIENKNYDKNGKTTPIQDSVDNKETKPNEQTNSHEQKLRIRNIAKLSTNKNDPSDTIEKDICRGSFECDQCNKTYLNKDALYIHVLSVHKGYPCSYCDYKTLYKPNMEKHVMSVHEGMKYPCSHCDGKFSEKSSLRTHILSKHEGKRYPCSYCDYKAPYKQSLENHVMSVHEGVRFPCSQCDNKYTEKKSLKRHMLNVHEGNRYPCSHCDCKFTEKVRLKQHILSKHEGLRFPCSHCDYKANAKENLKHLLRVV